MPLFEFGCLECGLEFEKLVMRAETVSEITCPNCGSRKIDEKISAFASPSTRSNSSPRCAPSGG